MTMTPKSIYGASQEVWDSAFHRNIAEFSAQRYVIYKEGELIRIALGNNGPPTDELGGRGTPVFSHAVTMPAAVVLELVRTLRDMLAEPQASPPTPS